MNSIAIDSPLRVIEHQKYGDNSKSQQKEEVNVEERADCK